jgi:23S rRNA (uracil1939-C5)-methyltransferase
MEREKYNLKIEKLINGGQSISQKDNYPIFTEGGCPDDYAEIEIVKRNKTYGIGKILNIIEPSQHRIKPFCPMHNVCGGCGLQYIEYVEQLNQKKNIVKETIKKIYGEDIPIRDVKHSNSNRNYRCKIQYPVTQTKVSKRLIIGYFKKNTHENINIKYCPVQPPIIDEITDFIRNFAKELNISGYNEKEHSGELRHIIYRYSNFYKTILITLVVNNFKVSDGIKKLAERLKENPYVIGVCINHNTQKTNVITKGESKAIIGDNFIYENINDIQYKISADSFFQVNPTGAKIIFDTALEMISNNVKNPTILDAYSGVSAFGLQMSKIAQKVTCVEENTSSTNDANCNISLNNLKNIEVINDDASKTFEKFVKQNKKFDVVLLDPPRKGCTEDSLKYASKLSNNLIIYVSCNPTTLARDLKYLRERSFRPIFIQPVDMFCHTSHIENVVLIEKEMK